MSEQLLSPYQWYSYLLRNRIRILMYHSISDDPLDPLTVSPKCFREQMALLAARGYCGISLTEVVQLLNQEATIPRVVCLTFDDGFRDFYSEALPVLQRYSFRATLFVVAGSVGETSHWSSYRKARPLLSWRELEAIVESGYEIGSHTLSHPDLRTLPPDLLQREIEDSKHILEDQLQVPIRHFAYPGGAFTDREVAAVAWAGHTAAVIVGGRWGNGRETHRLRLKREKMLRQDTLTDFWRKVYGYYELFRLRSMLSWVLRRKLV